MKNKKFRYKGIVLLLLLGCIISSCSNSNDGLNSKELRVYISTYLPNNELQGKIIQTPKGDKGNTMVEVPIKSTRPVVASAEVTLGIDATLVESYNTSYDTDYKLLPTESYSINAEVKFDKGEIQAVEPLKIEITNSNVLEPTLGYILPVKLGSVSSKDKGITVSANLNTVYIIYQVEFDNVDAEASSLDGTEVARNTMQIMNDGTDITRNLKDNNFTTYWYAESDPTLTIDMKDNISIIGFKSSPIYMSGRNVGDIGTISKIETSIDGESWEFQGSAILPKVGGSETNPEFQLVKFYEPVTCRYLRLKITSTNSGLNGISEFYLIK